MFIVFVVVVKHQKDSLKPSMFSMALESAFTAHGPETGILCFSLPFGPWIASESSHQGLF